jgi:hypothetical protein
LKETERYKGRLIFTARTYKNLPHWHGLLVNEEQLFQGRTNWHFIEQKPTLTVGGNRYRYFNSLDAEGTERIELFGNWHRYYFDFASQEVCSSES